MKKNIIIILLFLVTAITNSQNIIILKNNAIEKLDIKNPNIEILKEFSTFREERNDTITEYTKKPDRYVVNQYSNSSPMWSRKAFFLNGNIASETYKFYDVLVNTTREYDMNGDLVFSQNEEDNLNLVITVHKLVEIIKMNYQVDLMSINDSEKRFNVRYHNLKDPYYTVTIGPKDSNTYRLIEVDAITGDIIQDRIETSTK